jgi:hypothetical protein
MEELTVEQLELEKRRAAYCGSVALPFNELFPLIHLALRGSIANNETIMRVLQGIADDESKISGDDIRMIIDLALEAKLAERKPRRAHLRIVPSQK